MKNKHTVSGFFFFLLLGSLLLNAYLLGRVL